MNVSPLSVNPADQKCPALILLTLILWFGSLPAVAQSPPALPSSQIVQSSNQTRLAELQNRAEQALRLWAAQDFAQLRPYLSPSLQTLLPINELKGFWQEQVADNGQIKKIGKSRAIDALNAYVVMVPVEFEKTSGNVSVSFNENKEIAGINFPTRESIQAIAEKAVEAMAKGELVKARDNFAPELKIEISPQQLQQKWKNLQKVTGPFKRIIESKVIVGSNANEGNLVLVTLEFEKVTEDLIVVFNSKKQIYNVDFPVSNQ
jgi:hypothetical protein